MCYYTTKIFTYVSSYGIWLNLVTCTDKQESCVLWGTSNLWSLQSIYNLGMRFTPTPTLATNFIKIEIYWEKSLPSDTDLSVNCILSKHSIFFFTVVFLLLFFLEQFLLFNTLFICLLFLFCFLFFCFCGDRFVFFKMKLYGHANSITNNHFFYIIHT